VRSKYIILIALIFTIASLSVSYLYAGSNIARDNDIEETYIGSAAYKDKFPVLIDYEENERLYADADLVLGKTIDPDLIYQKLLIELPLVREDYYWGKHINATAGINEINQIKILYPGDRIRIIRDGYLTMSSKRGYVNPGGGIMYASGVCWSTSALGTLMDEANKVFTHKYQLPLFVFNRGDRAPHPTRYATYAPSNHGLGYSVVKRAGGSCSDYSFTVNPALKDHPILKDIKINIVMTSSQSHDSAFKGQSIGGYLQTNIDF